MKFATLDDFKVTGGSVGNGFVFCSSNPSGVGVGIAGCGGKDLSFSCSEVGAD